MLQHRRCRQTTTHVFLSLVGFKGDDVIEDDTTCFPMDDGWMDDGFKGDDALEDDITRNHSGWWMDDGFKGDDMIEDDTTRNQSSRCSEDLLEDMWDLCRGSLQRGTSSWSGIDWRKIDHKCKKYVMSKNCARKKTVIDKIKTFVILGLLCFMESVLVHPGNESLWFVEIVLVFSKTFRLFSLKFFTVLDISLLIFWDWRQDQCRQVW